ncbi:MAG TPA: hypothetical protein VL970_08060 [Candidatus Acidoferrales bacterium]|nr:hypothetical protein [Candidatus Acidoferrales bacterium]
MTLFQQFCLVLANLVLALHVAFVLFVVTGLVAVWVGRICKWSFVHNLWFRAAHLAAIGLVAILC